MRSIIRFAIRTYKTVDELMLLMVRIVLGEHYHDKTDMD